MKILNKFTIKSKILGLSLSVAFGITIVAFAVLYLSSTEISTEIAESVNEQSQNNLSTILSNTYSSCAITDQLINKILIRKINEAKEIIKKRGDFALSPEMYDWNCTNQVTKAESKITLPKMMIGSSWIGYNKDYNVFQPIIDDLREDFYSFTIFQKMNQSGDMLRIATNIKLENGERAIGTFIPHKDNEGQPNPIISNVMSGQSFFGTAYVVSEYYQTLYEPIKDKNGNVIGMIYTGVSLEAVNKLRESILNVVIGKSGFMYVLGASGARKGYYIISKKGQEDGKSVYEAKDIDGNFYIQNFINKAKESPLGSINFHEYPYQLGEDGTKKNKVAAVSYFKPFDWLIVVETDKEELHEAENMVFAGFKQIYIYIAIAVIISLLGIFFVSVYIADRIGNPISLSSSAMNKISRGEISAALDDISKIEKIIN